MLLFIVQLVANLTFCIFAIEEFTYGYRLKNIVWQLTISFATDSVIIIEQHRLALHQSRLAESVNPYNSVYQNTLANRDDQPVGRAEANFLASRDGFHFLIGVTICGGLFAAWQKQID
ncbi:hypothetical protein OKW34_007328 [Paraburkholderia youngii]